MEISRWDPFAPACHIGHDQVIARFGLKRKAALSVGESDDQRHALLKLPKAAKDGLSKAAVRLLQCSRILEARIPTSACHLLRREEHMLFLLLGSRPAWDDNARRNGPFECRGDASWGGCARWTRG